MRITKLDALNIADQVALALREDIGTGDITAATIPEKTYIKANLVCRDEGAVLAGQLFAQEVFRQVDSNIKVTWQVVDGASLVKNQVVAILEGKARTILTAERTALNFLQTLSGVATTTRQFVNAVAGTKAIILDTRKTIPGLRLAQKQAVTCGGGQNHRFGLYDAFLIKDNHISALGSVKSAIQAARALDKNKKLEIEVDNLAHFAEALAEQPDIIMLDNFNLAAIKEAVSINAGKVKLEVSGGVNLETVRELALTGVDYISVGALTKSVRAIDLALDFFMRTI